LETLAQDQRFDSNLALVREHWTSVRHLWLGDSELRGAAKFRSGLPSDFWIGCGMPGLTDIKPHGADRFEFSEDGLTAVILPAYDTIPGNLDANAEHHVEHLVDLIAVDPDHPDRFWRRHGDALVLGSAFLEIAGYEGEPVPVFKNPMTWLRSGGAGVVVLDWAWARDLLLDGELIAEDLDLGDRLEDALKPDISIARAVA
jgi:hypothetical protein